MRMTLQPIQHSDIPILSTMAAESFSTDPHTLVKQLGSRPFDLNHMFQGMLNQGLQNPNHIYIKACNYGTGDILGWCGWGFRGIDVELIRRGLDQSGDTEVKMKETNEPVAKERSEVISEAHLDKEEEDSGRDKLSRLHRLEDADMKETMASLMPPGTQCAFIISIIVSPQHQNQGVGSALLKLGLDIVNPFDIFTWAHASEQAYPMLLKAGFGVVRELKIDLDEYAPRPPNEKEIVNTGIVSLKEERRWGIYTLRYMKKLAES